MVFLQLCNLIASIYFYSTKQEDSRTTNSFDKEVSLLAPCKNNAEFSRSQKGRQKSQSSGRQHPYKSPGNLSQNGDKCVLSRGDQKGRASYINSYPIRENLSNVVTRKYAAFSFPWFPLLFFNFLNFLLRYCIIEFF